MLMDISYGWILRKSAYFHCQSWYWCHKQHNQWYNICVIIILPPANFVCGGYTVFTLSVRPCVRQSVTLCSLNILKSQLCLWWVYCFHVVRPCVRPSVTLCFLKILKSHSWILIKPCKHVHICKTNTLNKKVRARGQFFKSYFPL